MLYTYNEEFIGRVRNFYRLCTGGILPDLRHKYLDSLAILELFKWNFN